MSIEDTVRSLRSLAQNVGKASSATLESEVFQTLPADHQAVLTTMNGMTVAKGAFRLFGVRNEPYLDIGQWNAHETWRFAWGAYAANYLLFGESAWGDQYAYRTDENGKIFGPEVYLLDCVALGPEVLAGSFAEFLEREFLRNAREPYSPYTLEMIRRTDGIAAASHWVYTPSLALTGVEDLDTVVEMPAAMAMTIEGDIILSLDDAPPDAAPLGVVPWFDDMGRPRMRVLYQQAE